MATQILGKVGMYLRGEYNANTTYAKLDVVTYQGESYSAKAETTGNLPTNTTYWQKIVEKGYTPVKGTDYWTQSEQADIVNSATTGVETNIQPTLTQIENTAGSAETKADNAILTANTAKSIADGANQALSYANYQAMVTAFNSLSSTAYKVGQNVMIVTVQVPDLWISAVESTSQTYTYVDDATIENELATSGYIQVGYYKLSQLETQKVDLTDYVTDTDYATNEKGGVVRVNQFYGAGITSAGVIMAVKATTTEIDAKSSNYKPIVPANLDYAVASIVGHHETMTQAQYDALETKNSDTYYYIVEE